MPLTCFEVDDSLSASYWRAPTEQVSHFFRCRIFYPAGNIVTLGLMLRFLLRLLPAFFSLSLPLYCTQSWTLDRSLSSFVIPSLSLALSASPIAALFFCSRFGASLRIHCRKQKISRWNRFIFQASATLSLVRGSLCAGLLSSPNDLIEPQLKGNEKRRSK